MNPHPALLRVLGGEALDPPPIWLMRQAGRYLPEYNAVRKKAGSFLDLCFTPELAAEVTLQPIQRFDFDAAILFSDILVIPYALGQEVTFVEGQGPRLGTLPENLGRSRVDDVPEKLAPVFDALRLIRRELSRDKALIGFCGAPWTVATYMIAGAGSSDQLVARSFALREPERLQRLIDILVDASARYLVGQAESGADVLKIFDSWAGVLDANGFERWAVQPVRRIIDQVKATAPHIPIIAFARGAGARLGEYARSVGADAIAVDWSTPMDLARELVAPPIALQGNLDPLRLVAGGDALDQGVDTILEAMGGRAHIFNLGHGITPDTPIANVERLVNRVRGGRG